jgi:hypothetical protein
MQTHLSDISASDSPAAWLTSNGAVWFESDGFSSQCTSMRADYWHDGAATKFSVRCLELFRLGGDRAMMGYPPGDTTKMPVLDLTTGTTTNVPIVLDPNDPSTVTPALDFGMAPNGDLAGVAPSGANDPESCPIVRQKDGALVPVGSTWGCGRFPLYDGVNLVYTAPASPGCRTTLIDPAGNPVILAEQNPCLPGFTRGYHANWSNGSYALAGGFTAFLRPTAANVQQVWVLSPGHVQNRIETLGASSSIEAINPAGEVMFTNGGRRYLGAANVPPKDVSSSLGFPIWRCGRWFVVIGGTAFRIEGAGDDGGSGCAPPERPDAGPDAPDASADGGEASSMDADAEIGPVGGGAGAHGAGGNLGAGGAAGAGGGGGVGIAGNAMSGGNAGDRSNPGDASVAGGSADSGLIAQGSTAGEAASSGCGCSLGAHRRWPSWLLGVAVFGIRRRHRRRIVDSFVDRP